MIQPSFKDKVNRVLLFILLLFLGLGFRCFQLAVIHQDSYIESSKRPKRKAIVENAERGQICDRNGQVLASEEIIYQVSLSYDGIRKIPRYQYAFKDKKIQKIPYRSEYIKKLSLYLAQILKMDALDIEDFIHGKASLFPNQAFPLSDKLSFELYSRLHANEKDWPGLKLEMKTRRVYPQNKLASHVIGYMGAIHQKEYDKIRQELCLLNDVISSNEAGNPLPLPIGFNSYQEVYERYYTVKEKAYQYSSSIGKGGIEGRFDEQLRGFSGKRKVEVDIMGREKRTLPDSILAKPGDSLYLAIDANLQQAAESLLAMHEEKRDKQFRIAGKNHHLVPAPWIKGGAIVAMDPKTGQVLALASYPRFDPNDFTHFEASNHENVTKWLELPNYAVKIFEGFCPLEKEYFDPKLKNFYLQTKKLTLDSYLDMVLSCASKIKKQIHLVGTLNQSAKILKAIDEINHLLDESPQSLWIDLLYPDAAHLQGDNKTIDKTSKNYFVDCFIENQAKIETLKEILQPYLAPISHNGDKLLFIDLLRLFTPKELIYSLELPFTLSEWFELNQMLIKLERHLKSGMKNWFHLLTFREFRQKEFKNYLAQKRKEEKKEKKPQKPYLTYLEEQEKLQFQEFYSANKKDFLLAFLSTKAQLYAADYQFKIDELKKTDAEIFSHPLIKQFQQVLDEANIDEKVSLVFIRKKFKDLTEPLYGSYRFKAKNQPTLQDLALHFYPKTGFGFSRSYAFQEAAPQGSIFKVVTAYEALKQHVEKSPASHDVNPLTIVDNSDGKITDEQAQVLGFMADGKKINRFYKGGKLPRSSKRCGKVGIKEALEMSSNLYFSILAADNIKNPMNLTKTAKIFGFGSKTQIDLPGEIAGSVPYDILSNKTGLYALSIGQHSLVVTPLQTAKMFASIVNGGFLLKPEILYAKIKTIEKTESQDERIKTFEKACNVNLPFFKFGPKKSYLETQELQQRTVYKKLFLPKEIKTTLEEGLRQVLNGDKGTARAQTINFTSKEQKDRYTKLISNMIGKTASAEIVYHPCLDKETHPILCKHIWFSSCGYEPKEKDKEPNPEIVIVVYLRYGDYGKEAAVLATELYDEFLKLKKN